MLHLGRTAKLTLVRGVATMAMLVGFYVLHLLTSQNFHTVIAGELYRSSQPSPASIALYKEKHGIRSIVNLRGIRPDEGWYRDEVATAARLGLNHFDFPMSATKELAPDEVKRLIALMKDAPKPLLIHCKAGADRTGLAAAFYMAAVAGRDELSAELQISITYGHFSGFLSQARAMDETFEKMEPYLGFPNS